MHVQITALYRRSMLFVATLALALPVARAQVIPILNENSASPQSDTRGAKLLEYDVPSVKQRPFGENSMGSKVRPDGFICSNLTLLNLIVIAYDISQASVTVSGAPSW